MLWVYPELPNDIEVGYRANLWEMIESQLQEGSDDQWYPGFSYNGAADGTSLVASISNHDSIDWQYQGGQVIERVGAFETNPAELGDKASGRDFPAYAAMFTADLKMTVDLGKHVELQDSTFDFNGPDGIPVMTGIAQHPDGA